jgi:hypothetical protein
MTHPHQPSSLPADRVSAPPTPSSRPSIFLACGMVAGPLFFLVFTVAGLVRPDYDPLRHPVSSLEFGPTGWVQALNFIVTGTLVTLLLGASDHLSACSVAAVPFPC